jgi:hypothetical protein
MPMTEKEIKEHIVTTNKFPRTFDDYMNYGFLLFPMAFIAIGISVLYSYLMFNGDLPLLLYSILAISLGTTFLILVVKRLHDNITFISISSSAKDDIDNVAERLQEQFKLRRVDVNKELKCISAFTKMTGFSWGEQLTLIFDDHRILINSRPSGTRQPITIFKDRQNIKRLKQLL